MPCELSLVASYNHVRDYANPLWLYFSGIVAYSMCSHINWEMKRDLQKVANCGEDKVCKVKNIYQQRQGIMGST